MEESADHRSSADELESETDQAAAATPISCDNLAFIERLAELFGEPALADTGGEKGMRLKDDMLHRIRAEIPTTKAATLRIIDYVRRLSVYSQMAWDPNKDCGAVDAIRCKLFDRVFTVDKLSTVLESEGT